MAGFTDFIEMEIATNQGEATGKTIQVNATLVETLQAMEGSLGNFTEVLFSSGRQLAAVKGPIPPPPGKRNPH